MVIMDGRRDGLEGCDTCDDMIAPGGYQGQSCELTAVMIDPDQRLARLAPYSPRGVGGESDADDAWPFGSTTRVWLCSRTNCCT